MKLVNEHDLAAALAVARKHLGNGPVAQLEKTCRKRGLALTVVRVLKFIEMEKKRRVIWNQTK